MTSIESQLGGEALFDWRSEGLVCRLSVPLAPKAGTPEADDQPNEMSQRDIITGNIPDRLPQSARV
jgi:hypothetical protein